MKKIVIIINNILVKITYTNNYLKFKYIFLNIPSKIGIINRL